jgi:putative SOS response-associated peptidase YedK
MCGRYTIFTDADERELFEIIAAANKKYGDGSFRTGEIFPGDTVPVLTVPSFREPSLFTWGFPARSGSRPIINARSETAAQKPMFRDAVIARRCIIPSTGFYEWDAEKKKYLFTLPDSKMLYMAGLYSYFGGAAQYVILTAPANASVAETHNRMPVVLRREMLRPWLTDEGAAMEILHTEPPELSRELAGAG